MRAGRISSRSSLGWVLASLGVAGLALGAVLATSPQETVQAASNATTLSVPTGVTLEQINGGPNYYASLSKSSVWMDQHILLGAWEEQPLSAADVKRDRAMTNNIYWNLGGSTVPSQCATRGCRVNYNVIRANGMHAAAPDVTGNSGSETVAYEGIDESDLDFGPGSSGWNRDGKYFNRTSCVPSGSACGYTVAKFFYTAKPASYGSPGYPVRKKPIIQGFGKQVLFFETKAQADTFLKYSNTLSADTYWMSDPDLDLASQGGCALFAVNSAICKAGAGVGLTTAQRALPANYAFNVTRLETLNGHSKPILVDIETGCPFYNNNCTVPAAFSAAAWHAIIAGARGIIWFQHDFGGNCVDFRTFYDGSNSHSAKYNCQQTTGVTLGNVVENVSAVNHRIGVFNKVLLAPFAEKYVNAGKADISVMAKYYGGKFYVFAASGKPGTPPAKNLAVTFHLAGNYSGAVTVYGEKRTLNAVNGVFTDTFADQNSVHIYEIG